MHVVIEISSYDKEWITNGYYIPEEINTRISEAIAKSTPLPKGHGWIPVSERLPDDETDVLVCNKDGKIELTSGSRSAEIDDFIWYTSGWRFGDVVAWMPLPKPYEPQERSDEE